MTHRGLSPAAALSLVPELREEEDAVVAPTETLSQLADAYLHERLDRQEIRTSTARLMKITLLQLAGMVGRTAAELSRSDVERWLETRQGKALATRRRELGEVRSFCQWLVIGGHLIVDPTAEVVVVSNPPDERKATPGMGVFSVGPGGHEHDPATRRGRVAIYRQGLLERELAARTVDQYKREISNAEWWCEQEGYSLRNVPAAVLAEYVDLRPKTHGVRVLMRASFSAYWQIFERKNPPLWVLRVPRKPRMICRALTDDEARKLAELSKARGDKQGLAVLLGMYQGFRRAEIAAVRWDDFTDDGWIRVMGKGDLPAKLPVHPVVAEAAAKLEHAHPTWVFPGEQGRKHVSPMTVWKWIVDLAAAAGLEKVTPHRLRHTCLATANDVTGDLRAVSEFARHSRVNTTQGYTRTTERRLHEVVAAINYGEEKVDSEADLRLLLGTSGGWRLERVDGPDTFRVWRESTEGRER